MEQCSGISGRFVTAVSQVRLVPAGEPVSYGCRGASDHDRRLQYCRWGTLMVCAESLERKGKPVYQGPKGAGHRNHMHGYVQAL
jgi:hypothetical protein